MIERFFQFLPSMAVLASIAIVTLIYRRLVSRRFRERMKSIKWCKENQWKIIWLIVVPFYCVRAPFAEELIFRAPLIVIFSDLSGNAWLGIWISGLLFSSVHCFGDKINLCHVLLAKDGGEAKTDSLETRIADIKKKQAKRLKIIKLIHPISVLPLGILSGYYGIKYQSIWASVGVHFIWNLIVPFIIVLLVLMILKARVSARKTWHTLRYKLRRG
ncbi:MAG: CPBP family intramembrane metalloprotease [Candidatus Yanofskybacteria bacterium]|nr:CPBP family intramembrane metalloprotease [Candidatus Yanofskybacteria bacterium]